MTTLAACGRQRAAQFSCRNHCRPVRLDALASATNACSWWLSADGDASNIDNFTAADSIPGWRLVPNDNNIGQRNVYPVVGATGNGLLEEFDGMSFQLKNPFNRRARMSVKATLPPFLDERGWRIAFGNAGADAFALEPGGGRHVIIRLLPGRNFNAAEVRTANDPIIEIEAYATAFWLAECLTRWSSTRRSQPSRNVGRAAGRGRAHSRKQGRHARP